MRVMQAAGWGKRLAAIVYDTLILAGLWMVAGFAVLALRQGVAVAPGSHWYQLYLLAVAWAYFALSWWRVGQTVAARAWGLEVRDRAGRYPSLARASARAALAPLSIGLAGLGLIWCLFDPQGQSAHDRLSGTQLLEAAKVDPAPPAVKA